MIRRNILPCLEPKAFIQISYVLRCVSFFPFSWYYYVLVMVASRWCSCFRCGMRSLEMCQASFLCLFVVEDPKRQGNNEDVPVSLVRLFAEKLCTVIHCERVFDTT